MQCSLSPRRYSDAMLPPAAEIFRCNAPSRRIRWNVATSSERRWSEIGMKLSIRMEVDDVSDRRVRGLRSVGGGAPERNSVHVSWSEVTFLASTITVRHVKRPSVCDSMTVTATLPCHALPCRPSSTVARPACRPSPSISSAGLIVRPGVKPRVLMYVIFRWRVEETERNWNIVDQRRQTLIFADVPIEDALSSCHRPFFYRSDADSLLLGAQQLQSMQQRRRRPGLASDTCRELSVARPASWIRHQTLMSRDCRSDVRRHGSVRVSDMLSRWLHARTSWFSRLRRFVMNDDSMSCVLDPPAPVGIISCKEHCFDNRVIVRSFVRSFVRTFSSFVRSYVRSFVRSYLSVCLFIYYW